MPILDKTVEFVHIRKGFIIKQSNFNEVFEGEKIVEINSVNGQFRISNLTLERVQIIISDALQNTNIVEFKAHIYPFFFINNYYYIKLNTLFSQLFFCQKLPVGSHDFFPKFLQNFFLNFYVLFELIILPQNIFLPKNNCFFTKFTKFF